jgi:hypothetical protein
MFAGVAKVVGRALRDHDDGTVGMRESGVGDAAECGREAPHAPGADDHLLGVALPGHLDQPVCRRAVDDPGLRVDRGVAGESLDELPSGGVALVIELAYCARDRVRERRQHMGYDQGSARARPTHGMLEGHLRAERAVDADDDASRRGIVATWVGHVRLPSALLGEDLAHDVDLPGLTPR